MVRDILVAYLQDVVRLMREVSLAHEQKGGMSFSSAWKPLYQHIKETGPQELQEEVREVSMAIRRGKGIQAPSFLLVELRRMLAQAAWHMEDTASIYGPSGFSNTLMQAAGRGSSEMFSRAVARFLGRTGGAVHVLVQSATELDAEMRQGMVRTLLEGSKELVFPTFRVERSLLGGVRVFHGGRLVDDTWVGRARRLIRFTREKGVV